MRFMQLMIAAGVLTAGTIGTAQQVSYDVDRQQDFSKFRTYTWVRGTEIADPLNHRRIVAAIDAQLAAKGLVPGATPGQADVVVAYHASFDRDLQISGFSSGWGGYRFGGSRSGVARAEEIVTGTLIVDVIAARTREIVWRATATREIDADATPEARERNINRAVAKLFKTYPAPKPAGR